MSSVAREYSPVESFFTENYRTVGEVFVDFTKSPIVALVGGNDAGKTSTIKAITNLMYNSNNSECKKHIRTNTKGYRSVLSLVDGVHVERRKTVDGLNGYSMKKGDQVVCEYNKIETKENGLVPPEIADIIGVVWEKETRELLNIRTYESLLLFSLTSGSDNYRIMYNALKIGDINKAIKIGKEEVNSLKGDINTNLNSITSIQNSIKAVRLFEVEPVSLAKDKVKEARNIVLKLHSLVGKINRLRECNELVGSLDETAKMKPIDAETVSNMVRLGYELQRKKQVEESIGAYATIDGVQALSDGTLERMSKLISRIARSNEISKSTDGLSELDSLNAIAERPLNLLVTVINNKTKLANLRGIGSVEDENWIANEKPMGEQTLVSFVQLINQMNNINQVTSKLQLSVQEESEIMAEIAKSGAYSEEVGGFVKACPGCGSQVIVTLEELLNV